MDEYTFKDLIIDPETSGLENLIGKEVYFDDIPIYCIKWANEDYEVGILKDVRKDNPAPFFVETSSGCVLNYPCIIPKKEEPKPEYSEYGSPCGVFEKVSEKVDSKDCIEEASLYEQIQALSIEPDDLKEHLLGKVKSLNESNSQLEYELHNCRIEVENMREIIFKLTCELYGE